MKKKELFLLVQNPKHLDMFGDKVKAREQAIKANIPVIPGSDGPVFKLERSRRFW